VNVAWPARGRWLPFLAWWPEVTRTTLRADAMAALTGAVVVLPQAVAFATIAGLPPQYGLYAAMLPAIVAALWGSSRHLVSGPTTAISVLVFATLSPLAEPGSTNYIGMALTLALLAGVMQLAMGLARLGALVNFISHTVIVGFTAGAAFLIAASQVKHFFGLAVPRGAHFHEIVLYAAQHLGEAHLWVTLVAVFTLVVGIVARKVAPRWPYMLIAMVAGAALAALLDRLFGRETTGIVTLGALPGALPPLSMPEHGFAAIKALLFPAAVVAVIGLTEAVAIARSIAARSGQRLDADQEFIGQGLSNIVGSFTSAYPSSGSFNRSGVNYEGGARTPLAAALAAPMLLAIAALAAPLAAWLPTAALAGILFIVAWNLIDWPEIGRILRRHPRERLVLLLTWVGVLLDLEKGLFVGIVVSLLFYLYRTSQPRVEELVPPTAGADDGRRKLVGTGTAEALQIACPQLAVLRVSGSLYFGAVEHVREHFHRIDEEDPRRRWLLLAAHRVNFVDLAGARLIAEEARRRRALGGHERRACLPRQGPARGDGPLLRVPEGRGKHLDPKTRNLISVITKVHAQTERGLRQYLKRALRAGCTPAEVLDALLMAFPALGLAKIVWAVDIILAMDLPGFRPEAAAEAGQSPAHGTT
jgi:SulP family sulfate permease